MFCCRQLLIGQGDFLVKVRLAGTLLLLAGLITPTPALSDTWRDTVREQAQYFDHSDYPDYERPDKTDFLLQYENFYGLHDTSVLVVKFANELDPARVNSALEYLEQPSWAQADEESRVVSHLTQVLEDRVVVDYITPITTVSWDILESDRLEAEFFSHRQYPDLRLYYLVHLYNNPNPYELLTTVLDYEYIEVAYYPIPSEPSADIPPTTPNFSNGVKTQYHLGAISDGGLGARDFWGIPGGKGNGVRAAVMDGAATISHEDFPSFYNVIGGSIFSEFEYAADHGTSCLSIIGARDNGYGTTGIAPNSSLIFGTVYDYNNYTTLLSSTNTRAGDVVSISRGYGTCPLIIDPFYFSKFEEAIGRGVLVFISAGNSSSDISATYLDDNGQEREVCPNVSATRVAIVGGGTPNAQHCYMSGSNYGTKVKLQGWFNNVVTAGHGGLQGKTHHEVSVNFQDIPNYPRKTWIPDSAMVLVGDFDNSPTNGDDIISCWPKAGGLCEWHYTKNITEAIAKDNNGLPVGSSTIQFQPTVTFGSPTTKGHSGCLYVMGNFDGSKPDEIIEYHFSSDPSLCGLRKVDITGSAGPATLTLVEAATMPVPDDRLYAADINGDGRDDLILSRQNGDYNRWWAAITTSSGPISFPSGFQPITIGNSQVAYYWADKLMFADYDRDGVDDLIVARNVPRDLKEWWYSKGNGNGTFAAGQRIVLNRMGYVPRDTNNYTSTHIVAGRADRDDVADIFVRHSYVAPDDSYRDDTWEVAMGFRAPIANANRQLYTTAFCGTSAAAPMVAGAAVAIQGVFRNDGSSGCDQDTMMYLLTQTGESQASSCTYNQRNIGQFPNLPRAAEYMFLHGMVNYVNQSSQSGAAEDRPFNADIDGDGKDDIFYYRPSNSTFYYSRNLGNRNFSSPSVASLNYTDIAVDTLSMGDVDGDGKDDIVVKTTSGFWIVLQNVSSSSTAQFSYYLTRIGPGWEGLVAYNFDDKFMLGDIDGDGKDDMIIRTKSDGSWYWAQSDGALFEAPVPLNIGHTHINRYYASDQIRFADVNGDGYDDLVARRGSSNRWYISMNLKNNSLKYGIEPVIDGSRNTYLQADLISVGDYDGDGIADLFVRRPSTLRWFLSKHVSGWL